MQTSSRLTASSSLRAVSMGRSPGRRPSPSDASASEWKGAPPLPNHPRPTWAVGSPPRRAGPIRWTRSVRLTGRDAASATRGSHPPGGERSRVASGIPGRAPRGARAAPPGTGQGRGPVATVALRIPPGPARPPCRLGGVGRAGPGSRRRARPERSCVRRMPWRAGAGRAGGCAPAGLARARLTPTADAGSGGANPR